VHVATDGGYGRDLLTGNHGRARLNGGRNADTLRAGADDDGLRGERGPGALSGGQGRDRFDFDSRFETRLGSRRDEIRDLERGVDLIDLIDLIDMDVVADGRASEAFTWIARRAFSGEAGELRRHRKDDDLRL